jgi:predicted RNA-binding protein with PIN domain
MLRNDKVGKKIFNQKIKNIKEKYIDELDNYEEFINKKIVSIYNELIIKNLLNYHINSNTIIYYV